MKTFPVGFWNYVNIADQGPKDVVDWSDCGMSYAHGPAFNSTDPAQVERMRAILDAAAEREIAVTLFDRDTTAGNVRQQGEEAYRARVTALNEALGSHPACFGFYIGDEPKREGFETFCRATRIQREVAPSLQPFGNLLPMIRRTCEWVGYEDWGAYLDAYAEAARPPFLCYDHYSQMVDDPEDDPSGYASYFANLNVYREAAVRAGIPMWTTLLSAGHFLLRRPTEDDFRWQLHTALAHGAQGILWFFLYMREPHVNYRIPPIDEHGERTETYGWLSRVNRTFHKSLGPVMRNLRLVDVRHAGRAWGGTKLVDGSGRIARAEASVPLVVSEFEDGDGRPFVMVVSNSQTKNTQARLVVRGRRPRLRRVGWMGEEGAQGGGGEGWSPKEREDAVETQPWLAPGQAELYRIEDRPGS